MCRALVVCIVIIYAEEEEEEEVRVSRNGTRRRCRDTTSRKSRKRRKEPTTTTEFSSTDWPTCTSLAPVSSLSFFTIFLDFAAPRAGATVIAQTDETPERKKKKLFSLCVVIHTVNNNLEQQDVPFYSLRSRSSHSFLFLFILLRSLSLSPSLFLFLSISHTIV